MAKTQKAYVAVEQVRDRALAAEQVVGAGEVFMLNLLRFRAVADYSDFPELAPPGPISGAEAYARYLALCEPRMQARGNGYFFMGKAGPLLIGPEHERWDMVLIVRWPSVKSITASPADETYRTKIAGHRTAALEDSRLLPMAQVDPTHKSPV